MEGIKLHPETISFIEEVVKLKLKRYHELSLEDARERHEIVARNFSGNVVYQGRFEDRNIPCDTLNSGVPVRVYVPDDRDENCPIIVYCHGGGHTVGSINSFDNCCKALSMKCRAVFVSVGYRLAPENRWPIPAEDCLTVTKWVLGHKDQIGGSVNSKVGIAGDSAGGHISATIAHDVKGLDFQVLIYPKVCPYPVPSSAKYANAPGLSKADAEWFLDKCIEKERLDINDPHFFPIRRSLESFKTLPAAMIVIAEIDPIADDGREYAKKLKEADVFVNVIEIPGVCHGFFHMTGAMKETCEKIYAQIADFVKEVCKE